MSIIVVTKANNYVYKTKLKLFWTIFTNYTLSKEIIIYNTTAWSSNVSRGVANSYLNGSCFLKMSSHT